MEYLKLHFSIPFFGQTANGKTGNQLKTHVMISYRRSKTTLLGIKPIEQIDTNVEISFS